MKHSIITWDCAFRNFFHLLPSLADQQYDLGDVEVIVVQQRTRELADGYARREQLRTLDETIDSVRSQLAVRTIYLDEPLEEPYHPGRLLNAGLGEAQGEILSTMDADILLPNTFLNILDMIHDRGQRLVTMHRFQPDHPCGTTEEDWKNQILDYDLVLNTCINRHQGIPKVVPNKAPLLSARGDLWQAIEMYDAHRLFATAYTLFGQDISTRFNLLMDNIEVPLPIACVHPWHPTEVRRDNKKLHVLFQAQQRAIQYSSKEGYYRPSQRSEYTDKLFESNQAAIESAIKLAEQQMIDSSHGQKEMAEATA